MQYLFFAAIQTELLFILSFHVFTVLHSCTDFIIYTCLLYSRESAILVIDETFFSQPFSIKHWWLTQTVLNNEVKFFMKSCLKNPKKCQFGQGQLQTCSCPCFGSQSKRQNCLFQVSALMFWLHWQTFCYIQLKNIKRHIERKNELPCLNQCLFFCKTS